MLMQNKNDEMEEMRAKLLGSFLLFTQTFFPIVTGRSFMMSYPLGRESHFITIARELTAVTRGELKDLIINVPPGHAKSTLLCMWIAWCYAHYPDCQFLYISYSHELAAKHTSFIRQIMMTTHYRELFNVHIKSDTRAKDHFETTLGGVVKAFGSCGSITGQNAGLPMAGRFTGCVVVDDPHKPDEVTSETTRNKVIDNYINTIQQRPRDPSVPIIYIGQRLHEQDVCAFLLSDKSERKFKTVVLKAIDDAGNALFPEVNPLNMLLEKKAKSPYVFSAQFQQEPVPAGDALYRDDYFLQLDEEPDILMTFITCDTAETDKNYNDATVFSFFGLYEIEIANRKTGEYALHMLDCRELRIEPKDLQPEFLTFYADCMMHAVKPQFVAIEKKSTGVTLLSTLKNVPGISTIEVNRTRASGSKSQRFIEMQPILASKLLTFPAHCKHYERVKKHMLKITPNDSHAHDDIADSIYDGIKLTLIDKAYGVNQIKSQAEQSEKLEKLSAFSASQIKASKKLWGYK